ncbi:MAG: hypothetical protein KTR26_17780 [Flammeovirgaceae bacterium]|nr:hypothetical protein [Flammeovirgaceae bacterium]
MELSDLKKFVDYKIESNCSLLYYRWKEESVEMNEDDYKLSITFLLNLIKEHKLRNVISNQLDKKFTIGLSIQDWMANLFKAVSGIGVEKIAFIESTELMIQLSLQQSVEESMKFQDKTSVLFFKTEKDAYKWILDKKE